MAGCVWGSQKGRPQCRGCAGTRWQGAIEDGLRTSLSLGLALSFPFLKEQASVHPPGLQTGLQRPLSPMSVAFNGDFAPMGHVAMSGDIFDCPDWGMPWHLVGGGQRC